LELFIDTADGNSELKEFPLEEASLKNGETITVIGADQWLITNRTNTCKRGSRSVNAVNLMTNSGAELRIPTQQKAMINT